MRPAFGKVKTRLLAGIGSILAACSAAVYGLYVKVSPPPPLARYEAGSPIEAGQWQVVPRRAWVSRDKVYGVSPGPGQQMLVVEVDLGNRTRASSSDYADVLRPHAVPGLAPGAPTVAQTRDPRLSPLLHPGLAERVAYIWVMADSAAPPATLTADVVAKTYKPRDNLYGVPGWYNPAVVGRLALPLGASFAPGGTDAARAP